MSTSGKVISACGAALIVVTLVAAFIGLEGPTGAVASPRTPGSKAHAITSVARRDSASNEVGKPAVWVPHDVLVKYRNLPRAYGCDALWYKVRDILRAAGAWRAVSITPYDCKASSGSNDRSPQLEVRFRTLRTLDAAQARWAQTRAVGKIVTLEPGSPRSLSEGDCALLAQTGEDVLSQVSNIHVVHRNLRCGTGSSRTRYSLALNVLEPVASNTRTDTASAS